MLVASQFAGDASELALVQQINAVKRAMGAGRVVVLVNHDHIYESLYDVLNQRYVTRRDARGRVTKLLRLAIGAHSQLVPVDHRRFKVVVIADERDAWPAAPAPAPPPAREASAPRQPGGNAPQLGGGRYRGTLVTPLFSWCHLPFVAV